jgi:hypothetical protein
VARYTHGLPLPGAGTSGVCDPAAAGVVRFGFNATSSCSIATSLTLAQLATFCGCVFWLSFERTLPQRCEPTKPAPPPAPALRAVLIYLHDASPPLRNPLARSGTDNALYVNEVAAVLRTKLVAGDVYVGAWGNADMNNITEWVQARSASGV